MFTVKIGPVTLDVECPLLEEMAEDVVDIQETLDEIAEGGRPHIEFQIGPIAEKE